jgi:hypothetical protein
MSLEAQVSCICHVAQQMQMRWPPAGVHHAAGCDVDAYLPASTGVPSSVVLTAERQEECSPVAQQESLGQPLPAAACDLHSRPITARGTRPVEHELSSIPGSFDSAAGSFCSLASRASLCEEGERPDEEEGVNSCRDTDTRRTEEDRLQQGCCSAGMQGMVRCCPGAHF